MNHLQNDTTQIDFLITSFFNLFTNKNDASPDLENIYNLFIPEGIIIKKNGIG